MRIGRLTILLTAMAAFTAAGLSAAGAAQASPTEDSSSNVAYGVAATDDLGVQSFCDSAWRHSGHTANVRWYHCHPTVDSPDVVRVHICGYSGTLHGIYVGIYTNEWQTAGHKHDDGGEGC